MSRLGLEMYRDVFSREKVRAHTHTPCGSERVFVCQIASAACWLVDKTLTHIGLNLRMSWVCAADRPDAVKEAHIERAADSHRDPHWAVRASA